MQGQEHFIVSSCCVTLSSSLWEACPFLNRDRRGMDGEGCIEEVKGGLEERREGNLWLVCKINEKNLNKKVNE